MIIKIKKSKIARMLFVFITLLTYSWLVIWTMGKVTTYKQKRLEKFVIKEKSQNQKIAPAKNTFDSENGLQVSLKEKSLIECKKNLSLSNQRWFIARYASNIKTSWTLENYQLDNLVYEWWLTLQNSREIHLKKTLEQLSEIGVLSADLYENKNKCTRRCAVIGNSGNLKNSNYGKIIDEHEVVIRINKAPTVGFEKDVGSKTTHRFMYPESTLTQLPEETSFVLIPFKPMDIKWLLSALTTGEIQKTYMAVPKKISCNKSKIIILSPKFIWYVYNRWMQQHGRYPSTGFLAVIYALHECSEINLYGFGADENGNWHHYWENLPKNIAGAFKSTGVHDPEWEKTMLNILSKNKIITLNVP